MEQLQVDFRYAPSFMEAGVVLDGVLRRQHNDMNGSKLFTKDLSATVNGAAYIGDDLELKTSYTYTLRRGYVFTSANLNEGIWNVAIRYKFLKEKNASLKLECYDLLKQRKNVTYMMTVNGNNETRNDCISRFVLFTFNYRFSIFS